MKNLDTSRLSLALDDFFTRRVSALDGLGTHAAAIYLPPLRRRTDELATLLGAPAQDDARETLRSDREAARVKQDQLAEFIEATLAGTLADEQLSVQAKRAAARIRAELLPKRLPVSSRPKAQRPVAVRMRAALALYRDDLALLPVPTGGTLFERVVQWLAAVDEVAAADSARTDLNSSRFQSGSQLARVRSNLLGLLGRFQSALADEVTERPELPRDLDARLFAHFEAMAPASATRRAEVRTEVPAEVTASAVAA